MIVPKIKSALLAGITSLTNASFAADAIEEHHKAGTTNHPPACTVRLNRYTDSAPIDERYLKSQFASTLITNSKYSGITYIQTIPLQSDNPKFRYMDKNPVFLDKSFWSDSDLDGRIKADGQYHKMSNTNGYTIGHIIDAQYINWTKSYETDLQNPQLCLEIKHGITSWAPNYSSFFSLLINDDSHTSNSFSEKIWQNTGLPIDDQSLSSHPSVRVIPRQERIEKDRQQGQLKESDTELPPPFQKTNP